MRSVLVIVVLAGCTESARVADAGRVAVDVARAEVPDAALDAGPPELPPARLRVLFVGNSYTFVNDLPALVRTLAATAGRGPVIDTETMASPGYRLSQHWAGTAPAAIAWGACSAVVLQAQSVEPLEDPNGFRTFALRLAGAVTDAGARPVFFATWARRAGDPVYRASWSGGSFDAMTDGLARATDGVARETRASVAPVGNAWRLALGERPRLALYQADGSHPAVAGTYLAACVFYEVLVGAPVPDASAVPDGVSSDDARFLRGVAARAVALRGP